MDGVSSEPIYLAIVMAELIKHIQEEVSLCMLLFYDLVLIDGIKRGSMVPMTCLRSDKIPRGRPLGLTDENRKISGAP